jgi:hypothetical protein
MKTEHASTSTPAVDDADGTATSATSIGQLLRERRWSELAPWATGVAIVLLGYVPLIFLGPGTDLDSPAIYRSGRAILSGDYFASRRPGEPVYEALAGVLHAVGGDILANAATVAMTVAMVLAVVRLLQREGHPYAAWLGVAVLANPFVWIAGTSMIDHVWALGLALLGANAQQSRRWPLAAVLYALAAGCRLPTLILVAAFILADLLRADRADQRRLLLLGGMTAVLTALVFVPAAATQGWSMFDVGVADSTWTVRFGRWAVKNFYFFGPVFVVLVLGLVPRLVRRLPESWRSSTTLRMASIAFVAAELLFLRFPWKLAHLIPAFVTLVLVLGAARVLTRWLVVVLLVSQLVLSVVAVNVAQPDHPGAATGGRVDIEVLHGVLWRDLDCRVDSNHDAYRHEEGSLVALAIWACVVPWTGEADLGR